MSSTVYKTLRAKPIRLSGGSGAWLYGADGRRYLDACGGVCVSSLGHMHPRMCEAMKREAGRVSWAHAGSFTSEAAEALASFLAERSGGLARAQFISGGSEAMELALKIAYQYHCERGNPDRVTVVARRQSYHGSTFGTLAISGNRDRRSIFEPLLRETAFVSPCYQYRDQRPFESDNDYVARLATELDETMNRIGDGRVAAFVAEPVVGSTSGAVPPVEGYFEAVLEVCRRHGALLILDDVMSGMGRTGALFSHLQESICPDIVAVGKGLAAGYQPISGVLIGQHVYDAIEHGSGVLRNGQTHVNHPFACAIALEAQRLIEEDDLLSQVRAKGERMRALLAQCMQRFDFIGDVRGRGLFLGVELVADRSSKTSLREPGVVASKLKSVALDLGLLIYPAAGTIDGVSGNHVLFAPPFVTNEAEIAEMVDRFTMVLEKSRSFIEQRREVPAGSMN